MILQAEPPIKMYAQAVVYSNWPEWQLFADIGIISFALLMVLGGVYDMCYSIRQWKRRRNG